MVKKFSGIQKEVLTLYRSCLRAVYEKPKENRANWFAYIHEEFGKYRNLPRRDFATIEHLLRVGNRRYEMYKSPLIKNVH
ncbi:Succinate dehydrogenase assembly factor 1, mitochondrial [Pichia kudriavzevii]|uniref:Succinate dehydrogenase assembly factor 1, mitochondrial n=1 Tax=Pichia kudriavzevii TaxID=4909 RepID=A0A1V2LPZ6_PICKU|nr:Succinate dehydrogenase assembly factor 1, mitochondrial [Pichia kudriavzevii]